MYSEHGLLALMRAVFGQVCQSLTVVSNCMPGIAADPRRLGDLPHQVARLVGLHRRAVAHRLRRPVAVVQHRAHESSVTRTELLEFWKNTEAYAAPVNEPS